MLGDEGGGLVGDLLLAELDARLVIVALKMVTHFLEVTEADLDGIQSGELPFPSATGDDYFDDRRTDVVETRDELLLQSLRRALDELAPIMASHGIDLHMPHTRHRRGYITEHHTRSPTGRAKR